MPLSRPIGQSRSSGELHARGGTHTLHPPGGQPNPTLEFTRRKIRKKKGFTSKRYRGMPKCNIDPRHSGSKGHDGPVIWEEENPDTWNSVTE